MKILFVAAEPGSASVLEPIVKKFTQNSDNCYAVLCSNQAKKAWINGDAQLGVVNEQNSEDAYKLIAGKINIFQPDRIVSTLLGPFNSSLDQISLNLSRKYGISHFVILDSWMNIMERFAPENTWPKTLPDKIIIPDKICLDSFLKTNFPRNRIFIGGHPGFDSLTPAVEPSRQNNAIMVLIQPLSWLKEAFGIDYGYTEKDFLILLFFALESFPEISVIIRDHPRHPVKFKIPDAMKMRVKWSTSNDVWKEMIECKYLAGMSSTLLFQAFAHGLYTLNIQPNLSSREDPNILTRLQLMPLLKSVDEISAALEKGKNRTDSDFDIERSQAKKIFPSTGSVQRITKFIETESL